MRFNAGARVLKSDIAGLAGQHSRDVTLQHLLHQIEGIQDFADLADPAVAQGVKGGEVELQDRLFRRLRKKTRSSAATLSPSATRIGRS